MVNKGVKMSLDNKIEPKKPILLKDKLLFALIIIAIVALGITAVNQTLGYMYKTKFLATPCDLCIELNPHIEKCIMETPRVTNELNGFNQNLNYSSINLSYIN
jgi:hypothetical protein